MKLIFKALILYALVISVLIVGCEKPTQPLGAYVMGSAPISVVYHPFAAGNLTSASSQNSTLYYSTSTNGTYTNTEVVTIYNPVGYTLAELELSLIGRVISSNATSLAWYRWAISDDNVKWQALASSSDNLTGATSVNSTAWIDTYTYQGRFKPTGNFTGTQDKFYVTMQISCALSTTNVTGLTKGSSYIIVTWRGR